MNESKRTASYRILEDADGYRFCFYCDISGALLHTTDAVYSGSPGEALILAWEKEGRAHFNTCHKCGRYVSDVMWNADVLECVACAPWENLANYCPQCGHRLTAPEICCPQCGHRIRYEGEGTYDRQE